jgi:hypothetical protein
VLRAEPEAERAIIGALLLSSANGDAQCPQSVFGSLNAADFVAPDLRLLFAAAKRLYDRGDALEPMLWLGEAAELERSVAVTLLRECGEAVCTSATVGGYVRRVAEASVQRRFVCVANNGINAGSAVLSSADLYNAIDQMHAATGRLRGSRAPLTVCAADVAPQPVTWLWPGRLAIGKVTLLAGDPGLGKSLLTLDIAARVSRGAAWPDSPATRQRAGGVALLSAEDDLADTIRPRLDAHEADVSRVHAITSLSDLGRDVQQLRAAIDRIESCRLVIVDPISAYMGRADSHVNAEVRAVLAPLAELAAETGIAILAVTHLRKGEGAAMYRAMGSLAFVAAARAAWAVVRDKTRADRRLLLPIKNNLARDVGSGLAYRVESHGFDGAPVICWESAPVTVTADEALAPELRKPGRPADERAEAEAWLRAALADGPRSARDVTREATEARCISKRTLERAQRAVGVVAYRPENPGPWFWCLPEGALRQNAPEQTPAQEYWRSGGVAENTEFFDGCNDQNATSPVSLEPGSDLEFSAVEGTKK